MFKDLYIFEARCDMDYIKGESLRKEGRHAKSFDYRF